MDTKNLTISDIRVILDNKEVSPQEIFDTYREVIDNKDKKLNAFISVFDYEKPVSKIKSILNDIPCAVKDAILINGKRCTNGSKILENYIAPYDATTISKLKNLGVPFLGKTNQDEATMGSTGEYSHFGATLSPLDTSRVPGGSSSGSAVAVVSGMAPYALGTETGGSIRLPAAWCGVVGLKPSYGRVSRYGEIPMCSSMDQQGIIAKNVKDAALILEAIAGHDPYDSTSSPKIVSHYVDELPMSINGMKIAMPKEFFNDGNNPQVATLVMNAIKQLEKLGAIVEEVTMPMLDYGIAAYYVIVPAEVSTNMARLDGIRYGHSVARDDKVKNKDLYEVYARSRFEGFGTEVRRRIMIGTYALSAGYYDAYYKQASKVRTLIRQEFDSIFEKYDVIVGPTSSRFAPKLGEFDNPLDFYLADSYMVPVNLAGLPAISVPCGFGIPSDGDGVKLPAGLHIIGKQFDESTIFRVAHAFEQSYNNK